MGGVLVCWAVGVGWGWRLEWLDRMDGRLIDPRARHAFSNLQILSLSSFLPHRELLPPLPASLSPPSGLSSNSVPPSHGSTAKSKFISAKSLIGSHRCRWPYISLSAVSVRGSSHLTSETGSSLGAGTVLRASQCEWWASVMPGASAAGR